jgi:hypothetical protein
MVVGNEKVLYFVQTDALSMPKPFYALQIIVAKKMRGQLSKTQWLGM